MSLGILGDVVQASATPPRSTPTPTQPSPPVDWLSEILPAVVFFAPAAAAGYYGYKTGGVTRGAGYAGAAVLATVGLAAAAFIGVFGGNKKG